MNADEVAANYFKHLQRGQHLIDVGRWREALHEFNQHLIAFPNDYTALCQSAACYLQLKEFQLAYDTTKSAIEAAPEAEWAYRIESAVFTQNGEHKRALDAARLCIEKAPAHPAALNRLFWAQSEYGDLEDAEKTLKLLLRCTPDDSEAREAAAYLAMKQEKLAEAERLYLEALKLNPESIQALNNLGVIYLNYAQTGKGHRYKKKSVEMFERAVKLEPTFKLAQRNIVTASNAVRAGAPVGIFLLVWVAFQILSRVGSSTIGDEPGGLVRAVEKASSQLGPSSSIKIVADALSLVACAALAGVAIACIKKEYRERINYEFGSVKVWLLSSLVFVTISTLYLIAFWGFGDNATIFSGVAMLISLSLVFVSVINLGVTLIRRFRLSHNGQTPP